jgi:predicted TIM-barrel fold metal-dependent hydrolase
VEYPNLMLEIVATIPEPQRIRHAVETLGARRVFFGTDMTLLTPAYAFGLLRGARLDPADSKRILGLNAAERFGFA